MNRKSHPSAGGTNRKSHPSADGSNRICQLADKNLKNMFINYLGRSCFKIQGQKAFLVFDPFDPAIGLKMPKLHTDIVAISHDHRDHSYLEKITGINEGENPFVVKGPGEYEIKEVRILGIESFHDNQKGKERGLNTIYLAEIDGIKLVHLGDLGHVLEEKQLEKIGDVDILFIPVGGKVSLDFKKAVEVVEQIEPKIIIPMHFRVPACTNAGGVELDKVDKFLNEIEIKEEKMSKLKIFKKDLLAIERKVILLEIE